MANLQDACLVITFKYALSLRKDIHLLVLLCNTQKLRVQCQETRWCELCIPGQFEKQSQSRLSRERILCFFFANPGRIHQNMTSMSNVSLFDLFYLGCIFFIYIVHSSINLYFKTLKLLLYFSFVLWNSCWYYIIFIQIDSF